MVLLEQVGFQKTFPEVPIVFRGSCGNPESRQYAVLALGTGKGLAGDVGRSRTARCLRMIKNSVITVKEFTLFCKS